MATAAPTCERNCLPSRYQCPLCLDLLVSPVQLPCCRKHLCLTCFERAVDLTSTNCAFCRKRIVSFARRQSKKVDEALWAEIQAKVKNMDLSAVTFESVDGDYGSRPTNSAVPGELYLYYEQCKSEVERERREREQEQLAATLRFLESEATLVSPFNDAPVAQSWTPPPLPVYSIFATGSAPRHSTPATRKGLLKKSRPSQKRSNAPPQVPPSKKRWTCAACTYLNVSLSHVCAMCQTKSPS
ncbi:hypothetical protein H310_13382 [Aphanomyces invadans]|uniref:RING-type E3 ubiquitin transferase n=1 Tax=Aphanomyces invadans TaxID=157072 RepID=A0A024TDW2_9STRA|nr:hypothetical protein H310_13382 [Aphanomyces invadans]ETV92335.1 hypothetical protein H310_13382 [Aphanomyces invadans]|eukprot:XP_008879086.1 hypothetical protein H310_13382 [Aphanomyces invadans]